MTNRSTLLDRAAAMRRQPTEPEKYLWRALCRSQLGGYKFRRQAIIGNRIVDFFCPAKRLIVEVDGETHNSEQDQLLDRRALAEAGYRTVRITNADVQTNMDGVLRTILDVLDQSPDRWQTQML